MKYRCLTACLLSAVIANRAECDDKPTIKVGSKTFTESVILGEILIQLAEDAGANAVHRDQLGGTPVLFNALERGEIDVYAEYTGTLTQEIFAGENLTSDKEIRERLEKQGIRMSQPLGFNNTYALGMPEALAREKYDDVRSVSDLRKYPELRFGFSNEFMSRGDGWPSLKQAYQLPHESVRGLEHNLAYRGLESGSIDVIDLYSTDAEIKHYQLRTLKDDRNFFPGYHAVLLYRIDLEARAPKVVRAFLRLENAIDNTQMTAMNAEAKIDQIPERKVAASFLTKQFDVDRSVHVSTLGERLWITTREHLNLVLISVTMAIATAIPLGILAAKQPLFGQGILAIVGLLQTVPSLALLVFLIPLFGLGAKPAICALFLYSLLPIVRNTYAGLHDIPAAMHESAEALGLPAWERLRQIELPMAARSILAGIKTAVVINVGTATLGGLIGAGGYGDPILTGIRLDRMSLVLEGAIPSAVMALLAQGLFELVERRLVPKGLRLKARA